MTGKWCGGKCGQYLPLSDYYTRSDTSDGLYHVCKTCQKAFSRSWTKRNMDKHSVYVENYTKNNLQKVRKYSREYKKRKYTEDRVYRENMKKTRREKYANDPDYREKKKIYNREYARTYKVKLNARKRKAYARKKK